MMMMIMIIMMVHFFGIDVIFRNYPNNSDKNISMIPYSKLEFRIYHIPRKKAKEVLLCCQLD